MKVATPHILTHAAPLAACFALALFGVAASQASSSRFMQGYENMDSIRVLVNGDPVRFENMGPREIDGRLMVPLRGVLEKTGAYVDWDPATQTVLATRGDLVLELNIGSRNARVNGRNVRMDVPAMTISGNTMVPLRFVSESLGVTVAWDNRTRTVSIESSDQTASVPVDRENTAAHRSWRPRVESVTHNMTDNMLASGQRFRIVIRGTPGGQASFRIRGSAGEMKMHETESGVYEGFWRNNQDHDIRVADRNILASIVLRNVRSSEAWPDGINRR